MTVLRSVLLFALGALAEIGGAWLTWGVLVDGVRPDRHDLLGAPSAWPGWP
jgi:drug/metabolite transporter superfamily protein YnfA